MNIHGLRVQHVRSHSDSGLLSFPTRVSIITGANGSGKTSLLEAMYLALRGSSFRGSDSELLTRDADWWRVDLHHDNQEQRTVRYDSRRQTAKKKFTVQSKHHYRLPAQLKVPVVLFEPDDLRLLHGSPSRRRQFIDSFISQVDPHYQSVLRKYDRALKQRNALLKQHARLDDMFVWDMALSEYGAQIIERRSQIIARINQQISQVYDSIAATHDSVALHYSHTYITNIQHKLASDLQASYQRDCLVGYTTVGPHRHDVVFRFNDSLAMATASRGEVRSIVLALKFIEVDVAREVTGEQPIILLDDVFAELDESRQAALAKKCQTNQLFITTATYPVSLAGATVISLD